jgi:D-sedoheptulose 7-phosphate isomerase
MEYALNADVLKEKIKASAALKLSLLENQELLEAYHHILAALITCYRNKGKVLFCGNGGSAADAQHLAAELSGRFYFDRSPLYAEALHVNTSYLTAVANDYSFDEVFARLVNGMGHKGDVLIGLSTSGNSKNIVNALEAARAKGMITIGFTGKGGGKMKAHCDYMIEVPSVDTPRIQECHLLIGHTLCEQVESCLFPRH